MASTHRCLSCLSWGCLGVRLTLAPLPPALTTCRHLRWAAFFPQRHQVSDTEEWTGKPVCLVSRPWETDGGEERRLMVVQELVERHDAPVFSKDFTLFWKCFRNLCEQWDHGPCLSRKMMHWRVQYCLPDKDLLWLCKLWLWSIRSKGECYYSTAKPHWEEVSVDGWINTASDFNTADQFPTDRQHWHLLTMTTSFP